MGWRCSGVARVWRVLVEGSAGGAGELERAVPVPGHRPPGGVDHTPPPSSGVSAAEAGEVVQVGGSAVSPMLDLMQFGPFDWSITPRAGTYGFGAAAVAVFGGMSLGVGRQPSGPTHVQWFTVLVEGDDTEDRVAGAHVETVALPRQTICGFTPTGFCVGHDYRHLDHRPMRWSFLVAAQVNERFGQQLLPRRHRGSKRSNEFTVNQDPVGGVADRQFRPAKFLVRVMRSVLIQQIQRR